MLGDFPQHALRVARVAAMTVAMRNVLAGVLQIALLVYIFSFTRSGALLTFFIFHLPTREAFMMVSVICSQSGSD